MKALEADILFDGQLPEDLDIPALWEIAEAVKMPSVGPDGEDDSLEDEGESREIRRAGKLLLRTHHQTLGKYKAASAEDLQSVISTTSRHFVQLRRLGMCIVSHQAAIGPDIKDWGQVDAEDEVAFSASRFVEDTQPLHVSYIARSIAPAHAKMVITDPLQAYLDWCEAADEPYILWDIFTSNQYTRQSTSGIVFLADIDPVVAPNSEENLEEAREDLSHLEEYLLEGRR